MLANMHRQTFDGFFFKKRLLSAFLIFAGLFLVAAAEDKNPCDTIARKNNIKGVEQIKCIGRLKAGLLVVTTEMKVWQLDDTSLGQPSMNNTINQLYFGDQPPVPIETKWPKLAQARGYQTIKGDIPTCRVMIDPDAEWLFLDGTWKEDTPGMRWDINGQRESWGFMNIHRDDRTKFLSSNGIAKFYTITDEPGHLQIVQYSACQRDDPNEKEGPGKMVKSMAEADSCGEVLPNNRCYVTHAPHFRPICEDPGGTSVHVGKVGEQCTFVHWPVFTGFIDDGQFYFFGNDSVISVPEDAYTKSAPSKFEKIPYDSFIQCKVNPHPRSDPKKKKALVLGLIIALVLILLICCLCVLLCLARQALARRKRKKGKKGGKKQDQPSPLFPFPQGGVSRRSTGLVSPRNLSKRASSLSKRSRGGLSPGRKLSKRRATSLQGGGGKTRRSKLGASQQGGGSLKRGPSAGSTKRSRGTAAATSPAAGGRSAKKSAHNAVSNRATARSKLKHK